MNMRISNFVLCVILVLFVSGTFQGHSQSKKNRARVSLNYESITGDGSFLIISAKFRGDEGFESARDMNFDVYQVFEGDSLSLLGKVTTNADGIAKFALETLSDQNANEEGEYTLWVEAKNNISYQDTDRDITFKKAELVARIVSEEGINHLVATLVDSRTNAPISDQPLFVYVKRLFKPLKIGGEFISTDETGTISVPVDSDLPGLNGNLTLEVVLSDNDPYGTVKAGVTEPIGIPIVDDSTFNERTMWSPPGKTPLFLLVFPNLMIIGIWVTIALLIFNLFKINKSKS
ncbi:hypothetical protein [Muriicola soli]|uniref:Uncharacterized protein n=1 Tax=Muriicola soli TaxID=2507538 RepID=A0A411EA06_9FLAO|nr:hypothetical protein [Muriicola soli]QBA64546.1 hypothetical protein EQY75_08415 [Muriicola soli]